MAQEHAESAALLQELVADLERERARARDLAGRVQSSGAGGDLSAAAEHLAAALNRVSARVAEGLRDLGTRLEAAQEGRALGLAVIRGQEEERRRVAREIHDGPAQLLANVVLRIDVCQRLVDQAPDRLREELIQLKDLVRLSLQDVRKVIFDLRPMALDDLGLIPALRTFFKEYQSRTAIATDLAAFGADRRMDRTLEVAIFRLVQEALTNVEKHAQAAQVWVTVDAPPGKDLKVVIKDDGVGFEVQARRGSDTGHFGLVGMRERVELLGGKFEIQSAPGGGTRVQFTVPTPG